MYQINKLNQLVEDYHIWLKKYNIQLDLIEETILQKDNSDKIEEKIVSIGISSIFVSIVVGFLSLIGVTVFVGFGGTVVLFIIGWFLSKGLNRKIFGTERKVESLNDEETQLIEIKNEVQKHIKPITLRARLKKEKVNFTKYPELKKIFTDLNTQMQSYNASKLALKYRNRHSNLIKKQILLIHDFEKIYTGKGKS